MPVNTLRPCIGVTGDSTAFGTPSLVMVTCRPPATSSRRADNLALAARTGMVIPMPGSVAVSRKTDGSCGVEVYVTSEVFLFMAAM